MINAGRGPGDDSVWINVAVISGWMVGALEQTGPV